MGHTSWPAMIQIVTNISLFARLALAKDEDLTKLTKQMEPYIVASKRKQVNYITEESDDSGSTPLRLGATSC